jgi:hypothetical protein
LVWRGTPDEMESADERSKVSKSIPFSEAAAPGYPPLNDSTEPPIEAAC